MDCTWEEHVHELALRRPGAQLLDLAELRLETVVDPGEDVVPAAVPSITINLIDRR